MIITCMALNPMALAVFCGELIIDTINNMNEKIRMEIYGNGEVNNPKIMDEYNVNNGRTTDTGKQLGPEKLNIFVALEGNRLVYSEKVKSGIGFGFGYCTKEQHLGVGAIFVIYRLILKNRFDILEKIYTAIINEEINTIITSYIDNLNTSGLYELIYGIIKSRFKGEQASKEINILYSTVFNIKRNKENTLTFIETNKNKVIDLTEKENIDIIKNKLKNILNYDFLMTPLEGIYINENIIGLIKYMSSKLIKNTNDKPIDILNKANNVQEKISLEDQRNIARCWLMNFSEDDINSNNKQNLNKLKQLLSIQDKYTTSYKLNNTGNKYFDNIYSSLYQKTMIEQADTVHLLVYNKININTAQLVKQQKYLINTYASNKIYNFDKPIITDILSPYIENSQKSQSDPQNMSAIKDFKMFYLFGNYDDNQKTQFKCEHQIKLLNNTKNFIQAITQ